MAAIAGRSVYVKAGGQVHRCRCRLIKENLSRPESLVPAKRWLDGLGLVSP